VPQGLSGEGRLGQKKKCSFLKKRTKKLLRGGFRAGASGKRLAMMAREQQFFGSFI
jgi:hypothetical protein